MMTWHKTSPYGQDDFSLGREAFIESCMPETKTKTVKKGYWLQKNGEVIKISDMTDCHLVNAIRFVERFAIEYKKRTLKTIGVHLNLATEGSVAEVVLNTDATDLLPTGSKLVYQDLRDEYAKRFCKKGDERC